MVACLVQYLAAQRTTSRLPATPPQSVGGVHCCPLASATTLAILRYLDFCVCKYFPGARARRPLPIVRFNRRRGCAYDVGSGGSLWPLTPFARPPFPASLPGIHLGISRQSAPRPGTPARQTSPLRQPPLPFLTLPLHAHTFPLPSPSATGSPTNLPRHNPRSLQEVASPGNATLHEEEPRPVQGCEVWRLETLASPSGASIWALSHLPSSYHHNYQILT